MPKITADTVVEHIAQQEAAVIEAASRLFTQRGISNVSLADIAAEIGLARNSLYRYFPDKGHLLVAWFRREIAPLIQRCTEISTSDRPSEEKLDAWLTFQLDYLTAPEHQALLTAASELQSLSEDARADIGAGHRELYASLGVIVSALVGDDRDVHIVTMFIVGILRSAADLVRAGHGRDSVLPELLRSGSTLTH